MTADGSSESHDRSVPPNAQSSGGEQEVRRYLVRLGLFIVAGVVIMISVAVVAWNQYGGPLRDWQAPSPENSSGAQP